MLNTYNVGKLMYVLKTPPGIAEWKKDPEAMMDRFGLTEEDRGPIRDKVRRPFYDAGLHAPLLGSGSRAIGLEPMSKFGMTSGTPTPAEIEERKKFAEQIAKDWGLITPAPVGR